MKVTQEMIQKFESSGGAAALAGGDGMCVGLEAVLADVPDVVPFTFAGYPDNPVYLHKCGTVVDVGPIGTEIRAQVEAGECDCENTSPWMRIFVEKSA